VSGKREDGAITKEENMSIYVIDDHPLMRDAIVMVLRRLRPAENIVELERLDKLASSVQQRGAPTLFCLDLKLPDTNGVSGVRELKQLTGHYLFKSVDLGDTVTDLDHGSDFIDRHACLEILDLSTDNFVNFVGFNCFHFILIVSGE
jgi:DNA-binding response OmpR family regulator